MTTAPAPANQAVDAYDDAMNAQPRSLERVMFGEVTVVDVWSCVLEKGQARGKRPFDASIDDPDRKSTCITLKVTCDGKDSTYDIDQETLDWEKAWSGFTVVSLRKLNLHLRNLKGSFVQVKRVPTGETYKNKQQETKEKTALQFVAVYPTRDAMQAAADAFYKRNSDTTPTNGDTTAPTPAPVVTNSAEREFAKQALQLLWQASKGVGPEFLRLIASNSIVSQYFNEQSEEVQHYLKDALPF